MVFFTGIGIWAVLAIVALLGAGIFSVESDSSMFGAATIIIAALVAVYGFNIPLWTIIMSNPLILVGAILGYAVIGALYTTWYRWPAFIKRNKAKIKSGYTQWAMNLRSTDDNSQDAYLDSTSYKYNAWNHKERLGTWITLWPFAMLWTLIHVPTIWFGKFGKLMYRTLGDTLQKISRKTAKNILDKD